MFCVSYKEHKTHDEVLSEAKTSRKVMNDVRKADIVGSYVTMWELRIELLLAKFKEREE
jgi:hypothetical protein